MSKITVDFKTNNGPIKPMHAVNNGPVRQDCELGRKDNFEAYSKARIPYSRTHDASFCAMYGGEHIVDVHAIFPDFNANPYDESSYDFQLTDEYLQTIKDAGTEVFYRLGTKIEHESKKYGTIVPADFHKWAVICEHIIRHFNEGWAKGFHHNIVYWEIWNEPDGVKANGDKPNWSGTPQQFFDLYIEAATHLKRCFPNIKIGGPGLSGFYNIKWAEKFLSALTANGERVPLDFFSWHWYHQDVSHLAQRIDLAREFLDRYGYTETESILDEWNYVEGWDDLWQDSILGMIGMRGAAFNAACMITGQTHKLDMLMYYDARYGTVMNGLFDFYTYRPFKGYYVFSMYSELYQMEHSCTCESDDKDIYCLAATNNDSKGIMIAHYSLDKKAEPKEVRLQLSDDTSEGKWQAFYLDGERTMESDYIEVTQGMATLTLPGDSVMLLKRDKSV